MKILVIGDTHGKLNRVRDIWPKLRGIDLIAHVGDHYSDAQRLAEELRVPVCAVRGNCDSTGPDHEIIETEYGRIYVTHGHKEHVNYDLTTLKYRAMEADCRAVFFGHTHVGLYTEDDGIYFLNPGSLTQPRDESSGSYAIVRTAEESFDASIVYYATVMGGKSSPSGGFIRSILNYSDRF